MFGIIIECAKMVAPGAIQYPDEWAPVRTCKESFARTPPAALNCTVKLPQVETCMRSHLPGKHFMREKAERCGRCLAKRENMPTKEVQKNVAVALQVCPVS
jgi:hypothetical protein